MTEPFHRDFEAAYQGAPPWDIGAPQPEVVRLADEGAFRGAVLDVGCGTGENALMLAARGLSVTGLDGAPTAIARAREKATALGLEVPFLVGDALDLSALRQRFDTVLDCGLFHVFDDEDRKRYARSLGEAVGSGGQVQLLCFSDEEPPGPGPRRVSEWDLKSAFRGIFVLIRIRPGRFESRIHPGGARAWVATLTRL
ncbi:MAG TPA: class I SAM-dependent methyltransferase [Anaeromyxobacteraceae bacterium]|nr:class I SAM-dependent methyltransferase [Anaeromyxobacteraceae bacterium]